MEGPNLEHFVPILVTIIASGGFWSFLQFMINKHSGTTEKLNAMSDQIDRLDKKLDERSAISARIRILRFSDELMENRKHSKDSYDQCLSDITEYEQYCSDHPAFKNNQTARTVEFIKRNYDERLEKHDFL